MVKLKIDWLCFDHSVDYTDPTQCFDEDGALVSTEPIPISAEVEHECIDWCLEHGMPVTYQLMHQFVAQDYDRGRTFIEMTQYVEATFQSEEDLLMFKLAWSEPS